MSRLANRCQVGKLVIVWQDSFKEVRRIQSLTSEEALIHLNSAATSGNARPGGFAEFAVLEADLAIAIPNEVTFEEAATLPLCSLTAAQVGHYHTQWSVPLRVLLNRHYSSGSR